MNVKLAGGINLNVSLLGCDCFFCHTNLLFCSFLLVSNCFLATLASASVVLSALTANGKTVTVTDATVATDVHEALDVKLDLAAEVTFHFVIAADYFADFSCLSVSPILNLDVNVDTGLLKNGLAELRPMPKM